jgi:hypothetical protein
MEQTTNNNIKIVRLQSGEDVMANYYADEERGTVLLDNPMHIIFKRLPTGKSVMMMMPWLPIELIQDNNALIYDSDILTIVDPTKELVSYYNTVVYKSLELMDDEIFSTSLLDSEEDVDEEYDMEENSLTEEELLEILNERKKQSLQ